MNDKDLNQIFRALSDATRRSILLRLSQGDMNITTLAEPYGISQPAISRHVNVLHEAGLITRTRQGREYIIRANPIPAEQARDWIAYYTNFWNDQFDAVDEQLQQNKDEE